MRKVNFAELQHNFAAVAAGASAEDVMCSDENYVVGH